MVATESKSDVLLRLRSAKRIDSVSVRIDRERRVYIWTVATEAGDITIEGGPEQLAGMLLSAQSLLSPELGAPERLMLLGQN